MKKRPAATNSLAMETDGGVSTICKSKMGALEKKERVGVSSKLYYALVVSLIATIFIIVIVSARGS